jgi:hypothetical protein
MDKLFFDFLSTFLQEHGCDILDNAAKFKALISDHAKGEFKDEIRLIYQMVLSNYLQRILEATEPGLYGEVSRTLLGQLKKEFFLDDETAVQVIQGLFGILKGYTMASLPEKTDAGTQRIQTALKNAGHGLKQYLEIMDLFPRVDVSRDRHFQSLFTGFYGVRHPRKDFYEGYYRFMEIHKNNAPAFINTLRFLYGYGRLDTAFASKLLATINPNLPVWDQFVLKCLRRGAG